MNKHYYFIGIGGIGMSGLAKILLEEGNMISGSDPVPNQETETLSRGGAQFNITQTADNITNDIDIIVTTAAIPDTNPELVRAHELGLTVVKRSELLNTIINTKKSIAVTGTHGKTTTSSMLSEVLIAANKDPLVVVGAEVESIGSNSRRGEGEYSVAEVCEYQRAFLDIHPYAAIITNIDSDHLDCYRDIEDIKAAFTKFVGQIDPQGFLVYCGDDKNASEVAEKYLGKKVSYGYGNHNDIVASNVVINETESRFTVAGLGEFTLKVPGRHNILNALAVIAVSNDLKVEYLPINHALAAFRGAERRFQLLGVYQGTPVIDDYAHHPTELTATLAAARERYPNRRIVAVFQPHQYSRTKLLLHDFVSALTAADKVIVPEIYAVRDKAEDISSVSSKDIVDLINIDNPDKAVYFKTFEETIGYIKSNSETNDVVLTIGAGPIYKVGEELVES